MALFIKARLLLALIALLLAGTTSLALLSVAPSARADSSNCFDIFGVTVCLDDGSSGPSQPAPSPAPVPGPAGPAGGGSSSPTGASTLTSSGQTIALTGSSSPNKIGCIPCDGQGRFMGPGKNGVVATGLGVGNAGERSVEVAEPAGTLRNLRVTASASDGGIRLLGKRQPCRRGLQHRPHQDRRAAVVLRLIRITGHKERR